MTGVGRIGRWGTLLLAGVAAGIYVGGVQQAARGLLSGDSWSWAEMAAHVVAWAVLGPPIWSAFRRAVDRGSLPMSSTGRARIGQSRLISRAMTSSTIPPDADPAVWRPSLRGEVRELVLNRWLTVAFTVAVSGSIGTTAAVANGNDWRVWAVAFVVAAEGLIVLRWSERRLRTARQLLGQLSSR